MSFHCNIISVFLVIPIAITSALGKIDTNPHSSNLKNQLIVADIQNKRPPSPNKYCTDTKEARLVFKKS